MRLGGGNWKAEVGEKVLELREATLGWRWRWVICLEAGVDDNVRGWSEKPCTGCGGGVKP